MQDYLSARKRKNRLVLYAIGSKAGIAHVGTAGVPHLQTFTMDSVTFEPAQWFRDEEYDHMSEFPGYTPGKTRSEDLERRSEWGRAPRRDENARRRGPRHQVPIRRLMIRAAAR